ncbi:unnamed protein product [Microthlaspi erraticum]|uniref:Uncharacterized protein n=1 Tax=Microthlaspi erraticum TaxID=1685480 RepID=A0A6D2KVV5_9BRAS|nr:unnamed protein product [Microthlaspi erraticum]
MSEKQIRTAVPVATTGEISSRNPSGKQTRSRLVNHIQIMAESTVSRKESSVEMSVWLRRSTKRIPSSGVKIVNREVGWSSLAD